MKMTALYLSLGLAACIPSLALADDMLSKDDQALEESASNVDREANRPEGTQMVESRLKSEFKVDDSLIQGLRDQKLGYGEISIVLALAEKRPGGITDANIQAIMTERLGPPKVGWGQIAKKQHTTLGKLNGKLKRMDAAGIQDNAAKAHEKRADKAESAERRETAQRPERAGRIERSAKPGRSKS